MNHDPIRILFFGSGAFGLPTLRALADSPAHRVVGVVSQPDRPSGRGGRATPTPIAAFAAQHLAGAPLIRAERVSDDPVRTSIRDLPADAWVVIAFGQKLSPALLEGRLAVNLHASRLPRWRGAAPINAAILAGDTETGNSVITLAERMDAGLVLAHSRRPIDPETTAGDLHDLLAEDGPGLLLPALDRLIRDGLAGEPQDETKVTKAPKLTRADGWVDFTQSAEACRRRINGLSPWPGVTVRVGGMGGREVKLLRAVSEPTRGSHPGPGATSAGRLAEPSTGGVICADGSICRILLLQPAGGTPMTWSEFVRGAGRDLDEQAVVDAGRPTC